MSKPIFCINELINNFPDLENFRNELYKKNILSKDYVDENLFLVYHKFEQQSTTLLDNECRSLVIDRNTKKIISFSCETPIVNSEGLEYLLLNQQGNRIINKCYEGTLLSVFYHGSKWYISTRRCLNSNESIWGVNKSHFNMFMEVLNNSGYENLDSFTNKLNKDYCYYFVLIHFQNKNVVQFTLPPKYEGVVIKCFDTNINRYRLIKLQTMNYQFAKSIGSEKNIFMGLIHLYQTSKLNEYVTQMPNLKKIVNPLNTNQSFDTIGTIDALFKVCTSEIFELFKILYDIKNGKHIDNTLYKLLPKEYKDILFSI